MSPRSLYECYNAKTKDGKIYCSKGHKLGSGHLNIRQMDRGESLIFKACQFCKDFEEFDIPYEK